MLGFPRMGQAVLMPDPSTSSVPSASRDHGGKLYAGAVRPLFGPYSAPTPLPLMEDRDRIEGASGLLSLMPASLRKDPFIQRNFPKLALLASASREINPGTGKTYLKVRNQVAVVVMDSCTGCAWRGTGFEDTSGGGVDPPPDLRARTYPP